MEPIVSPWFFYFTDIAGTLKNFLGAVGGALLILSLFAVAFCLFEDKKVWLKRATVVVVVGSVLTFLALITPGTDTVYKMAAANQITVDNVDALTDGVEGIKDTIKQDVIDIINATTEHKK